MADPLHTNCCFNTDFLVVYYVRHEKYRELLNEETGGKVEEERERREK